MKINTINILLLITQVSIYADNGIPNTTNPNSPTNLDKNKQVKLPTSIITTTDETKPYQSGNSLSKNILESNPSGNGDITSILRILPNVQYDNAQLKSTTPGEIDPANMNISGGLFYQNNFQLDGFNMNNDLNTIGGADSNNLVGLPSSRSQGLNVDTQLLESIVVQDSNVSAAYGRFTGGVKALWDTGAGLWTNSLGYSRLQNSRRSDSNFYRWWYYSAGDKNWTIPTNTNTGYVYEGGYGNIDQLQNTLNYKSDMTFEPLELWKTAHTFRVGGELIYQDVSQHRLDNTYSSNGAPQGFTQNISNCRIDNFGLDTCSNAPFSRNGISYLGQYMNSIVIYNGGKVKLHNLSYGIYAENDIKLDLQIWINTPLHHVFQ